MDRGAVGYVHDGNPGPRTDYTTCMARTVEGSRFLLSPSDRPNNEQRRLYRSPPVCFPSASPRPASPSSLSLILDLRYSTPPTSLILQVCFEALSSADERADGRAFDVGSRSSSRHRERRREKPWKLELERERGGGASAESTERWRGGGGRNGDRARAREREHAEVGKRKQEHIQLDTKILPMNVQI